MWRYVPLRLSEEERLLLRVLEGTLSVSEYTDKVDTFSFRNNRFALVQQHLGNAFAILTGNIVTAMGRRGQDLVQDRAVSENADVFASIFEVGRRHKAMNPSSMRSSYGKLIYMLQDASAPEVRDTLGFQCVRAVLTVKTELEALGAEALLDENDLGAATAPVQPGESAEAKAAASRRLVATYGGGDVKREARIERVLLSMADDAALTLAHVRPVARMLELLHVHFSPSAAAERVASLQISAGRHGARLSHSHAMQFAYVEQSLQLWREILSHLPQMWCLADADLLDASGAGYRLRDTGQGVHRVQAAPHVGRFMQAMLHRMQAPAGASGWVGSSAVHLGDNDVPNALVWIDKYTRIPHILGPILAVLDGLEPLVASAPGVAQYVEGLFGSADAARRAILADFFKHGFDGSGADNFYDAGSCIDGRLTSAWNWCAKLPKKDYYHLFQMSGFTGFDGDGFNK